MTGGFSHRQSKSNNHQKYNTVFGPTIIRAELIWNRGVMFLAMQHRHLLVNIHNLPRTRLLFKLNH